MSPKQLQTWLIENLKRAEPIVCPSTIENPQSLAITATKKLAFLGLGNSALYRAADQVTTAKDCAAVLVDCLRALQPARVTQPVESAYLDIKQLAALYGINERSVRRRVSDGTLPQPEKIGRSVRWRKSDLELD